MDPLILSMDGFYGGCDSVLFFKGMEPMDTGLDQPVQEQASASREWVETLFASGHIDRSGRQAALDILHPRGAWQAWLSQLLLILGAVLSLTGVIFFFAVNWQSIPAWAKFTIVELAIAGCLVGAWRRSLERLTGKMLLLSAGVLVGVFLAIFGQAYQTGADSFVLFLEWAVLILGWAIISRFPAYWALWVVLANLAVWLYFFRGIDAFVAFEFIFSPTREMTRFLFIDMALLNGAILAAREWAVARGVEWLKPNWTRIVPAFCTILPLSLPIWTLIVAADIDYNTTITILGLNIPIFAKFVISSLPPLIIYGAVAGILGLGLFYACYRLKAPSLGVLTLTMLSVCLSLEVLCIRVLVEMDLDIEPILLIGFLFTVVNFGLAVMFLRKIQLQWKGSHESTQ